MHDVHQRKRLSIRTKEHVLSIVEGDAVDHDAAGPAAESLRLLEQRDGQASCSERHGGGAPGPSAADDGEASRGRASHGARSSRRARASAAE